MAGEGGCSAGADYKRRATFYFKATRSTLVFVRYPNPTLNTDMISPVMFPILLLVFAGGGGNDLLDFVPSDAYFKAAKIEVTVPALSALLEAPVPEGAARRGDSARRQMALRALGELGDDGALPLIAKYVGSDDPLVADYARAARAAIEGKEYRREGASEEDLRLDLSCLPSGVGVIGRVTMKPGAPLDVVEQLALVGKAEGWDAAEMESEVVRKIGEMVSQIGNLRLHALTFGLAGKVGNDTGFLVLIARGLYDHKALSAMLGDRIGGVRRKAGGLTFHELDSNNMYVAPVSDQQLVFIAGASTDQMPLAEVGAKVSAGGGDFTIGKTLAKLLDKADKGTPGWALVEVTESYRESPFLKPFDTLSLQAKEVGGRLKFTVSGLGTDAAAVAKVVARLNGELEKAREAVREEMEEADGFPGDTMVKEILEATSITADGGVAQFATELPGDGAAPLLQLVYFGLGGPRALPAPDDPPEVAPADGQKAPAEKAGEAAPAEED